MSTYSSPHDLGRAPATPAPSGRHHRFPVAPLSRRSVLFGTAAVLLLPAIGAHLVRRDGWVLRAEDI